MKILWKERDLKLRWEIVMETFKLAGDTPIEV